MKFLSLPSFKLHHPPNMTLNRKGFIPILCICATCQAQGKQSLSNIELLLPRMTCYLASLENQWLINIALRVLPGGTFFPDVAVSLQQKHKFPCLHKHTFVMGKYVKEHFEVHINDVCLNNNDYKRWPSFLETFCPSSSLFLTYLVQSSAFSPPYMPWSYFVWCSGGSRAVSRIGTALLAWEHKIKLGMVPFSTCSGLAFPIPQWTCAIQQKNKK